MSFIVKLKSPNAQPRFAHFDARPSWKDLASKITDLFGISTNNVRVIFLDEAKDDIALANEQDLQTFYELFDQPSGIVTFVVQDLQALDTSDVIASTWSAGSNLSDLSNSDDDLELACWVLNVSDVPLLVDIEKRKTVDHLKKAIKKAKKNALRFIDSDTLGVWKLSSPIFYDGTSAFLRDVQNPQQIPGCVKLNVLSYLSEHFSSVPPNHIHIIVQVLPTPSSLLNSNILWNSLSSQQAEVRNVHMRRDTVVALYQRLKRYPFVQVRGTPASGKTVLAQLLATHILQEDPDVRVIWIPGWPLSVTEDRNYRSYLKQKGWDLNKETVFIFDEAQATYRDGTLWHHFFKSIHTTNAHAIIFCGYGSPSLRIHVGDIREALTPIVVPDPQRVTLRHVDHEDDLPPVGLLFTRSEFNDLVKDYKSEFDESFFDAVYRITNGHVGAIRDFLQVVITDDSCRESKHAGKLYTWDLFLAAFTPEKLLRKLSSTGIFGRGLPSDKELQSIFTADVFSAVLRMNVVREADFGTGSEQSTALQRCFRNGWLHADTFTANLQYTGYFFPSSLHRWYVEWKLWGNVSQENFQGTPIHANSLLELVIDVIRRFSPRFLSAERRLGPGCIRRPPEARYQDELYRCCHALSEGSLVTFPEFGTAKGRVDFYIPAKSWGIELLRDGDQLATHWGRFSKEGSYRTTISLTDYIIVDCRTTRPSQEHPHMSKLYHAVFEDNFSRVCILDNKLREVRSFSLLESS